ncbi:MAG: OmpH family outer membrane protein [Bacteroidales bacterium]|nr:OmpH family outer membrane protein [Bacteroidales bacterium]
MKKILFGIFGLLLFSSFAVNAQKIGFCEIDKIITLMPEYQRAEAQLEGEVTEIQNQLEEMQVEFNNKYKEYNDNVALKDGTTGKWSPAILKVKEQDLTQLQQRIQEFQYSVQDDLQNRQYELLEPISVKLDSVIDVVMKEKGFTFIIKDLTVIQINRDKCEDISPLVKQRLGLE